MNTDVWTGGAKHRLVPEAVQENRLFSWGLLSRIIVIIGIVCVGWALVNIAQSTRFVQNYSEQVSKLGDQSDEAVSLVGQGSPGNPIYAGVKVPEKAPVVGDIIGSLWIPALNQRTRIIQGTGTEELKKGVGHFVESVMPGAADNCVLSGHRDSVFAGIGALKPQDILVVEDPTGNYTYVVTGTRIVDKNDKTVIVPSDHGILTLTTCYPFRFIGNAPQRFIVTADLIKREMFVHSGRKSSELSKTVRNIE